jgi:hypothetical protein
MNYYEQKELMLQAITERWSNCRKPISFFYFLATLESRIVRFSLVCTCDGLRDDATSSEEMGTKLRKCMFFLRVAVYDARSQGSRGYGVMRALDNK